MLNHKHNACKSKSKILLLALCIFGLIFSYSCNCRNNSTAPDNTDPTVFSISTSSFETRLVQKASDTTGKSFAYQPSIKFSEANNNAFTVDYEVTDNAGTFTKENTSYDASTGLITFTDLSSLAVDKKTITIKFTVKANDTTLQNPETNFTLEVSLKKTEGTLPSSQAKDLVQKLGNLQFDGGGFINFYEQGMTVDDDHIEATVEPPNSVKADDPFSYSKTTWKNFFLKKIKENNPGKNFNAEFTSDRDAGSGKWLFELKFTFSDEDYDLTDAQKANGMDYKVYADGKQLDDGQGGKKDRMTWLE